MEKESLVVQVVVPKIGHGNPASALAIAHLLGGKPHLFGGIGTFLLRKVHQRMSQDPALAEKYAERSENLRGGIGLFAIGFLQLSSWLSPEILLRKKSMAEVGIFVQEHLLGVLPNKLLERWFPKGVFLAVPNVYPPESAYQVLKRKGGKVRPIVWNKQAFDEFKKKGFNPILVRPFLPAGFVADFFERDLSKIDSSKVVVKSSGSGMPEKFIQEVREKYGEGYRVEVWLPEDIKVFEEDRVGEVFWEKQSLEDYMKKFFESCLNAGRVVTYPSEMVQVISAMILRGWRGKVVFLPSRGRHEVRNLYWFLNRLGIREQEAHRKFFEVDLSKAEEEGMKRLVNSLGTRPISEVISRTS